MCTVVVLRRPGHPRWPLLLAANRDERLDRPWDAPGRYWPGAVAGRDRLAGGTWTALSDAGVVAAVLNRPGSLGPAAGKRSRGALPLLAAVGARDAAEAAARVAALDAGDYRTFNLVLADGSGAAFFARGLGAGRPEVSALGEGVGLVTAHDPNDAEASPRVRRHLPRFRSAPPPDPDAAGGWAAWEALLADAGGGEPGDALRVPPVDGFGTVSASLLALAPGGRAAWRFAAGPPGEAPFRDVSLGPSAVS